MKKLRYTLFLVLLFFSAQAAHVDTIQVFSPSMNKNIKTCVIVPDNYKKSKKKFPVVYLLHGYSGNYATWVKSFKEVSQQVDRYGFIAIGVDGNYSSWYFNSPIDPTFKYETYIIDELVPFIDKKYKTIASREGRAISGLSMGGHGALYLSLKHQDVFGAAGSMSGGVDIRPFSEKWDIKNRLGAITDFPENWEKNTVVNLIELNQNNNLKLIIDCGVDDFLIESNRELHRRLVYNKVAHDYTERPGAHTWEYWENALPYHVFFFSKILSRK